MSVGVALSKTFHRFPSSLNPFTSDQRKQKTVSESILTQTDRDLGIDNKTRSQKALSIFTTTVGNTVAMAAMGGLGTALFPLIYPAITGYAIFHVTGTVAYTALSALVITLVGESTKQADSRIYRILMSFTPAAGFMFANSSASSAVIFTGLGANILGGAAILIPIFTYHWVSHCRNSSSQLEEPASIISGRRYASVE